MPIVFFLQPDTFIAFASIIFAFQFSFSLHYFDVSSGFLLLRITNNCREGTQFSFFCFNSCIRFSFSFTFSSLRPLASSITIMIAGRFRQQHMAEASGRRFGQLIDCFHFRVY